MTPGKLRWLAAGLLLASVSLPVAAADIISEWKQVEPPPVPELKPVQLDGRTTALLVLDLHRPSCTLERRARCVPTIANVKRIMDMARPAGAMVFYTLTGADGGDPKSVDPSIAPKDGEWISQRGPDKFLGSDLEKRLKERGIKTVIVTGSSAQGVVIGTGSGAALRGYKVIVPVDTMSADDAYGEQYTAWHMFKGGPALVTDQVTVTRSDMIKF